MQDLRLDIAIQDASAMEFKELSGILTATDDRFYKLLKINGVIVGRISGCKGADVPSCLSGCLWNILGIKSSLIENLGKPTDVVIDYLEITVDINFDIWGLVISWILDTFNCERIFVLTSMKTGFERKMFKDIGTKVIATSEGMSKLGVFAVTPEAVFWQAGCNVWGHAAEHNTKMTTSMHECGDCDKLLTCELKRTGCDSFSTITQKKADVSESTSEFEMPSVDSPEYIQVIKECLASIQSYFDEIRASEFDTSECFDCFESIYDSVERLIGLNPIGFASDRANIQAIIIKGMQDMDFTEINSALSPLIDKLSKEVARLHE